jgi:hypothetical protein
LLVLRLNDRRHSRESAGEVKHERRRGMAHAAMSEDAYRGRGRPVASPTWMR